MAKRFSQFFYQNIEVNVEQMSKSSPFSLKFRILGVLSGTALAKIRGESEAKCELCGPLDSGQEHLALHGFRTQHLRAKPENLCLASVHPFTRCTRIPCSSSQWPLYETHELRHLALLDTERSHIFTDGSAFAPNLPRIRISGLTVSGGGFVEFSFGLTAGGVRNIARAETMAVSKTLQIGTILEIYCDESRVVQNLTSILGHGFHFINWRSHPTADLWCKIAACVIFRRKGSIRIFKVKSQQSKTFLKSPLILTGGKSRGMTLQTHFRERKQDGEDARQSATRYSGSALLNEISNLVFRT